MDSSRVFRQVVTMEFIWHAEPGEVGFRDWEARIREMAVQQDPPCFPGQGEAGPIEELVPKLKEELPDD